MNPSHDLRLYSLFFLYFLESICLCIGNIRPVSIGKMLCNKFSNTSKIKKMDNMINVTFDSFSNATLIISLVLHTILQYETRSKFDRFSNLNNCHLQRLISRFVGQSDTFFCQNFLPDTFFFRFVQKCI